MAARTWRSPQDAAGFTEHGVATASFQAYADHLDSAEFAGDVAGLMALASARRTALMCAEAVCWRCHRSLICDVPKLRGVEVIHIIDARHSTLDPYTSASRIVDGRLNYALPQGDLL